MKIKMLADHRELQFGHTYVVTDPRGDALVRERYAVEVKEPTVVAPEEVVEPRRATAEPKGDKAVAQPQRRRKRK